jgi:hypothetical protein
VFTIIRHASSVTPFSRNRRSSANGYQTHDVVCIYESEHVRSRFSMPFLFFGWMIYSFDRDYVPLVDLIGVFFQIRDDLLNLSSAEVMCLIIHNGGRDDEYSSWHNSMERTKVLRKTSLKGNSPFQSSMAFTLIHLMESCFVCSIHSLNN